MDISILLENKELEREGDIKELMKFNEILGC